MTVIYCFDSIIRFRTGTLTKVFVDRIFQECLTYEDEMVHPTIVVNVVVIVVVIVIVVVGRITKLTLILY